MKLLFSVLSKNLL